MNKRVTFITDLDHTIIHSNEPTHRCVERHFDGRPITYMSERSYRDFQTLLATPSIELIPCTMRSLAQVQRIEFFKEFLPRSVICSNGAQIYVDGVLDEVWEARMRASVPHQGVFATLKRVESCAFVDVEIRVIEKFYLVVKCRESAYAEKVSMKLKAIVSDAEIVFTSGKKVFIINQAIDKRFAVEYLDAQHNFPVVITSGDSYADQAFTRIGQAILPRHATFTHQTAIVTQAADACASDEIIAYVLTKGGVS